MYTIIGKRPGMYPLAETNADPFLGRCISETWIGAFVRYAPDGVVIEGPGPNYYETIRGELRGIDPNNPGEMITTPRAVPAKLDTVELARDLQQAVRSMHLVNAQIRGRV